MPKVVYTSAKGLVQETGSGISFDVLPYTSATTTITTTANNTGSLPGVYVITAGGVATVKMPTAASYPGGMFIFRNGDTNANVLTGSGEVAGTKVFAGVPGTSSLTLSTVGSQLTIPGVTGCSVTLISDGVNYQILAASGSYTIAGT